MDKPLVWIATPLKELEVDGVLTPEIFESLAPHYRDPIRELMSKPDLPWRFELCVTGGGCIAGARNTISAAFLASKADLLFFVDYDLMPDWTDFVKILSKGLPVCGGLYTVRDRNGGWVMNNLRGRAIELGGGFKCYAREALETVTKNNPGLEYMRDGTGKKETAFFCMAPAKDELWSNQSRWLTEDYWLDMLCRHSGIAVVADLSVKLKHYDARTGKVFPDVFPPEPDKLPPECNEP
jgi:hypothetical protein